jgi:signal transduction histidine kinase
VLASDSYSALAKSIERIVRNDVGPVSAPELPGLIDRIMLEESRAGELRLAYLRVIVVASYVALTLSTLAGPTSAGFTVALVAPTLLGVAWLAAGISLVVALRQGWYRQWLPRLGPMIDAGLILAGFLAWSRIGEPTPLTSSREVLGYVTALCAFLSLSGALRLSRSSSRTSAVLAVVVFLVIAIVAGVQLLPAAVIAMTLLAVGYLAASVTPLIRRVVTDEVVRATLTRMYDDAKETIDAREQVLKIVSHDLRNPLHTISMCASLLLEVPTPPDKLQDQLKRIKRATERMNRLIQDLLDVAKFEAGRLAIDARPIEAASVAREAYDLLVPLATEKSIRLDLEVVEPLPKITADAGRVLQVLSNLVGNAIKFTPPGKCIVIRADLAPAGVRFSVGDAGPGMSNDQLSHIFSRFWQANPADRRGIGLGLTIAKGIVDAHGGRIWVESRLGEGSTFYFTLGTVLPPTVSGASERRAETSGRETASGVR